MRILYGVVGEGMGHAIRSKAVIEHLLHDEGHEVEVVVSGRAHDVLAGYFPGVHRIWGLTMTYQDNEFKMLASIVENAKNALTGIPDNVRRYFEVTQDFRPQCVISDFESWSYLYGMRHGIPVISLDNVHMVHRCTHPREFIATREDEFNLAKAFVKGKTPGSAHYYVCTFFYPPVRKRETTLVPSVLRKEILAATPSDQGHVLVYQTSESGSKLPEVLHGQDRRFLVYGFKRGIQADELDGNITYRPFSEDTFIRDLASASAVISNGGFTVLSESVYLRKPVLSIPIRGQFEQVVNAWYIENEGFGAMAESLDASSLASVLDRLDFYRERLSGYSQDGNSMLFRLLDERLDRISAGFR